jgi:hypothetical protein
MMLRKAFFLTLTLVSLNQALSQVIINEICPRNATNFTDFYGNNPDWLELLNTGQEPINLKNWSVTDDNSLPGKWKFPELILPPDSHLVICADKTDRKLLVDHWETIIKAEDNWKYWIPDGEPDSAWKNHGFNDSEWLEGPGGFGRGDGDDNTILPDSVATIYIRKTFTITDISNITCVLLHMDYDDAFVAYLNGVEIARTNIGWPGRIQKWDDYSYGVHPALMIQGLPPEQFQVDLEFFHSIAIEGENVLAIQGLNAWNNHGNFSLIPFFSVGINSDSFSYQLPPDWFGEKPVHLHTNFNLGGEGESFSVYDENLNLVDMVDYPYLHADHSYGRETDGGNDWKFFGQPTPGSENNLSAAYSGYAKDPQFSIESGFYPGQVAVGFSNYQPGDTIRYTIDGSWVTDSSAIYTGESIVSDTTISLKAQVYKSGYLPGKTMTNTYIIGYTSSLPVMSISLNPHDLWDWEDGIYVLGPNAESTFPYFGANFWQEWEKPAHIEYFDNNSFPAFELDADLMIHGGFSRALAMKSLRVLADRKYDESQINYQLFKDKDIYSFKKFVLRNSGQDFNVTHFRDALMQKVVQKETSCNIQDYQPVVVFLNGSYWGIHNMTEKIDRFYVNENFGIHEDSTNVLRDNIIIVEGNYYHYSIMIDFAKHVQAVDSAAFDSISKMVDIANYTDYFIAQMYYVNPEFPRHNTKYWRATADTSKWRYIMTDLDFGLGLYSYASSDELYRVLHTNIQWSDNHWILRRILEYPEYRRYFINRSADMFNTMLKSENVIQTIHEFKDRLASEMEIHMPRWGSSVAAWESNVNSMINFVTVRLGYVWTHYLNEFGLEKTVTLTLDADPGNHGKIKISTIIPDSLPWQGIYFDGNPVEITAIADSGYCFSHWATNMVISGSDTLNPNLVVNADTSDIFKAYFIPDTLEDDIPYVIFSEINYHSSDTLDTEDWVEIRNADTSAADISAWVFRDNDDLHTFVFPQPLTLDTGDYLVLCRDTTVFRSVHPEVSNVLGPFEFGLASEGDAIRLFDSTGTLAVQVNYSNQLPWDPEADGTGKTLELKDPWGDLNSGDNWFAGCPGGSPGEVFSPCDTIDIAEHLLTNPEVTIFPNPASETVNFHVQISKKMSNEISAADPGCNIKITSLTGYVVAQMILKPEKTEITDDFVWNYVWNCSKSGRGIYFVRIDAGNGQYCGKLVVK